MKIQNVMNRANLAFPDDILLSEPEFIAAKLREARIPEHKLPEVLSTIFEGAIDIKNFADIVPRGLTEGTIDSFKILTTARWANFLQDVKPTISTVAKFSKLNRNFVSTFIRGLENVDLVCTQRHERSELVIPTPLATLYINALSGNVRKEYNLLKQVADEVKRDKISSRSLKFLEHLETAFHLAKLAYNENTLNYEIMEDLHSKVRELVVKARHDKDKEIVGNLAELLDIFEHMIKVREKATKMGVRSIILEKTGEKLGRARVFRVK